MIVVFRDPIERLFSQWLMVLNRWPAHAPDWPGFLTRFAPDGLEDRIPEGVHVGAYRMQSGVVRGYYGAQLERGLSLFGARTVPPPGVPGASSATTRRTSTRSPTSWSIPRFETYPDAADTRWPGKPTASATAPTGDGHRRAWSTATATTSRPSGALGPRRVRTGRCSGSSTGRPRPRGAGRASSPRRSSAPPRASRHAAAGRRRPPSAPVSRPTGGSPGLWSTGTVIGRCCRGSHSWVA